MSPMVMSTPPASRDASRPLGVSILAAFSIVAALIAFTSALSLLWPGGPLEPMWRLNPPAREGFARLGPWAILLLGTVSVASAFAATGLWRGEQWGRRLAMTGLTLNALGDLASGIVRHDARTLVGLPILALILLYLGSRGVRAYFARPP